MANAPEGVARAYDRWAGSYDRDRNATRDLDAEVLRREIPGTIAGDVLEAGCGTGRHTAWIAGRARSVTAMDFSEGMLALARRRVTAPSVRWLRHDISTPWPLAGASHDLVLVNLVLEHVRDVEAVLHEAARVLRPGGDLFVSELHPERQRRGGQAHFTDPHTGATVYVEAFRHTVPELVNAALAAGLAIRRLGEWIEGGASEDAPPRLISLHAGKPAAG